MTTRKDFGPHVEGPRTHENCIKSTGVARPGKTAHDHATGAWRSSYERRQRQISRNPGSNK